jgi:two-component system, NarL family, invasion response regulator UvrY
VDEVRVLVVDDQEKFRDVVREVIDVTPGFVLVGEAGSGEEAVAAVGSVSAALVLMDVRMPGIGGIQATRQIGDRYPGVVVMLMSVDPAEGLPDAAHACGAAAFLPKQDLRPRMLRDVWEIHQEARGKSAEPLDAAGENTRHRPSS